MSWDIDTAEKDVAIHSSAFNGMFKLTPYSKSKEMPSVSFSYEKYASMFKSMWDSYLTKNQKPELLGHTIPEEEFFYETIHCIAPNSFYFFDGKALPDYRESLLYWLISQKDNILKIKNADSELFIKNLEGILVMHLKRKEYNY